MLRRAIVWAWHMSAFVWDVPLAVALVDVPVGHPAHPVSVVPFAQERLMGSDLQGVLAA